MPKHEAQQKLAEYIEEYTGKLIHQGQSIESFAGLWKAFSAVKAGSWSKKMREDMKYMFDKHAGVSRDKGQDTQEHRRRKGPPARNLIFFANHSCPANWLSSPLLSSNLESR